MKAFVTLCAIVAVVSAVKRELIQLPPESLNKMHKIGTPCAEEFNVDPINIRKLGDENLSRDEATNKFLHCFGVNSGIVDKDGHMVPAKLLSIVGDHPLAEQVKEAIAKCNEITKENPVATTVAMHICYSESFPIIFGF